MADTVTTPVIIHRHDSSARQAARKVGIDIPFPEQELSSDEIVRVEQEETDID